MVLIYFTGEAYPNCLMFVSCHTITERILDKSDRNLFYDHVWSFNGVLQESCSMISVRFTKTTIFRKIFCTILQDHTRFCFKIMHGRTRIVYDQRVWLLAMGIDEYEQRLVRTQTAIVSKISCVISLFRFRSFLHPLEIPRSIGNWV